ncbi:MAG: DinB family protein [Bacteroidota bacterium]|nr:DinB family protein [Bacteroidota bacterium]
MNVIPFLIKELEQEAKTTRKFLKLVNPDKFQWKPHEKSMSMKNLAVHIAEIPAWVDMAVNKDELDFSANSYKPTEVKTTDDLVNLLNQSEEKALAALQKINEDDLLQTWTLRNGDTILMSMTRYEMIRHAYSQTTHHRAQLGVYLRLLDIPIPGSYGPSADEQSF